MVAAEGVDKLLVWNAAVALAKYKRYLHDASCNPSQVVPVAGPNMARVVQAPQACLFSRVGVAVRVLHAALTPSTPVSSSYPPPT